MHWPLRLAGLLISLLGPLLPVCAGAQTNYPDKPPFRLFEIDTGASPVSADSGITTADKKNPARRSTDRPEVPA